jgi:hypothetical protein
MEKKNLVKRYSQSGPTVCLYLDDIEEVITLVDTMCGGVIISDDDYVYGSLSELIENRGRHPSKLRIVGVHSFLLLEVRRFGYPGVLLASSTDDASVLAFVRVAEILERRRALIDYVFPNALATALVLSSLCIVLMLVFILLNGGRPTTWIQSVFSIVPALSLFFVGGILYSGGLSQIHLDKKHNVSTFWSVNRDSIINGVILIVVGGVLTTIGSAILRHFW